MGWLLACFGCTKKRKRPKKASKFGPKSRRIRSYQPLESDVLQHLHSSQALSSSNLEFGEKPKEEKNATRIGKRVRFNLEVTTYELLPADDDAITNSLDYEEGDQNWEEREEEEDDEQRTRKVTLGYMPLTKPSSYASNHRYNNCYYDDDEYHDDDDNDDIEDELSDLDDDEEEDDEYHDGIPEEYHHIISVPLSSSDDGELVSANGSKINTRFRSHYVVPVLNPIENLSQWKAVKARRKC